MFGELILIVVTIQTEHVILVKLNTDSTKKVM
jgi:hypothetical protein